MRTNSRITLSGKRCWVYEDSVDPKILEQCVPAHPNYSPDSWVDTKQDHSIFSHEEAVVIDGRVWTI